MKNLCLLCLLLALSNQMAAQHRGELFFADASSPLTITVGLGAQLPYLSSGRSLAVVFAPEDVSNFSTTQTLRSGKETLQPMVSLSIMADYALSKNLSLGLHTKYTPQINHEAISAASQSLATSGNELTIQSFGTFHQLTTGNATQLLLYGKYTTLNRQTYVLNAIHLSFFAQVGISSLNIRGSVPYVYFSQHVTSSDFNSFAALTPGDIDPVHNSFTHLSWQLGSTMDIHVNRKLFLEVGIGFGLIGKFTLFQRDPGFTDIIALNTRPVAEMPLYSTQLTTNNLTRSLYAAEIFIRYSLSRLWN